MKIAFLATAYSIHSIRWIKYFAAKGHRIVWISLAPPLDEAESLFAEAGDQIHFYEISPSPLTDINGRKGILYMPSAAWKIAKILKTERPEFIHIHSAGTYGLAGVLAGFHPALLTPWGSDILLSSGIKRALVKYVVKKSDYFTCDGKNTFDKLVKLGANPQKIEIIRFGVEVEKFTVDRVPKTAGENVRVISLRTLEPVYNIETLVRAAAIVLKSALAVEFVIAGGGGEKDMLQNLARELGVENSIKFTGRYDAQNLPQMLKDADIYVSTALSDSGLASSTAEAMASGLPVAVSDSGDNREWIAENRGGYIVPLKNPEALAEKLVHLARNQEARVEFGKFNRNLITEKYNYSKEMDKVEKIYELLGRRQSIS